MKRIAILVIAATNQPVYLHYIKTYWTELIRHSKLTTPHIDVFLLFENGTDLEPFSDLRDHIIQDPLTDPGSLCDPRFHTSIIPGILSKTVYALELLQGRYDAYFRTNLSSMIRLPYFDQFVQNKANLVYSGGAAWHDALRQTLVSNGSIGPNKSIQSLSELDGYPGNTFISGRGYFLSADEVQSLLQRKDQIRYDIVDDVSMGLMFSQYEYLPDFSLTVLPQESVAEIKSRIRRSNAPYVRLQHFPLDKIQRLWQHMEHGQLWQE